MLATTVLLSLAVLGGASNASTTRTLPAWARRYNVACSHCHAPAVPRLNATGIRFRWAGYRMPEDIGQPVEVQKVENYIALRGRFRYNYEKTQGESAENSAFNFNDATVFYAGPLGKNFGAFFEIEREAEDDIGLMAQIVGAWGTEESYGGFRAGQIHWALGSGVAGFDRPTGINRPRPVADKVTTAVPFSFRKDQVGGEAYYVAGRNRIAAQVLNGIDASGGGTGGDIDTWKDFVVTDQILLDEAGSGIMAVGYYGSLKGLEPLEPNTVVHYWRLGLSANKIIQNFEVSGTLVYGQDKDLPIVSGGEFANSTAKGVGYWLYGGYTFRKHGDNTKGGPPATWFARYEFADANTQTADNAIRRMATGFVVPVNLPEYLRLAFEYSLDLPQGGGPKHHGLTTELMIVF